MCQRLATSQAWSRARAVGTVRRRLAHVLSMLMGRSGIRDARGVFVPLRLPRSDLADLAGCRVETAVRQLTSWRDAGLLHTVREGLVVTEPEQLIRIAEGP
jgi:CRP-like cAMP-binding protein